MELTLVYDGQTEVLGMKAAPKKGMMKAATKASAKKSMKMMKAAPKKGMMKAATKASAK